MAKETDSKQLVDEMNALSAEVEALPWQRASWSTKAPPAPVPAVGQVWRNDRGTSFRIFAVDVGRDMIHLWSLENRAYAWTKSAELASSFVHVETCPSCTVRLEMAGLVATDDGSRRCAACGGVLP